MFSQLLNAQTSNSGAGVGTDKKKIVEKEIGNTGIIRTNKKGSTAIAEVRVTGNRKIESDAILARIGLAKDQVFSLQQVHKDVRSIFDLGFFYDVVVDRKFTNSGIVVTYKVEEKPLLAEIVFEGNEEIDDEELEETVGIKAFEIQNITRIQEATEKIEKLYEDKGFFLANVDYKLIDLVKGETQKLVFDVQENDQVKIKKITFLGNKHLKEGFLKGRIQTQEGGLFSFMSGSGAYKQEDFDRDMQILNFLYFNEGFVQVKIDRPQVTVTPDKKNIYITVYIEEGIQYNVGNIDFSGDLLFSDDELREAIKLDDEEGVFVWEKLQNDLRALQAKYGDLGYAFANVIPRTNIRNEDKKVDVTFEFDKGQKVYFGKINVIGNSKTRDKVIRRELKITEGELYNETRKRESIDNVRRLGFFEEVNFNTSTPVDKPDRLNVDVVIKERNTGTIQVGAGYSSFSGFIFNGQVNQINFLGKGQKLGVSLDLSSRNSLYNISFTEPYLFDSKWSLGFDVFRSQRLLNEFEETKTGAAVRVGHPLAEHLRGFIRYKLDDTNIELNADGDEDLFPVETVNGITSSITLTLEYDKRNDRFSPSAGSFWNTSVEYAGLGGDLKYTKATANFRFYKKVFWDVVWRNNFNYGIVKSNNSNDVPFNELFLLGGANSLRGYDFFSVGKTKASNKVVQTPNNNCDDINAACAQRPFGGEQQVFIQTELEFPLIREAGIKGVVFYDIGNADDTLIIDELRSDVGFGFRWFSPIGPLRFEWGFPIARRDDEDAVSFQFAIGSPF